MVERATEEPSPEELAMWPADCAIPWLYDRYAPRLYNLGLRFCGDPEEAEDLVQEVLLAAYRSWDHFDGRAKPTTWFYTIAARACQRRHRLRVGEPVKMESLDEVLPSRTGYVADLRSSDGDPYRAQVERQTREAVETAIAALPVEFRMPLVLKDIAELSLREVAAITGVPAATVKTRVHRGRLRLRKELDQELLGKPAPTSEGPPQVCYDLLNAKLEAMDQGFGELSKELTVHLCDRCGAVFSGLDAVAGVCSTIANTPLPESASSRLEPRIRGLS